MIKIRQKYLLFLSRHPTNHVRYIFQIWNKHIIVYIGGCISLQMANQLFQPNTKNRKKYRLSIFCAIFGQFIAIFVIFWMFFEIWNKHIIVYIGGYISLQMANQLFQPNKKTENL